MDTHAHIEFRAEAHVADGRLVLPAYLRRLPRGPGVLRP